MGVVSSLVFCCLGSAYGMAKCSVGLFSMGVIRPELVMRSLLPPIMAGIIGIYGMILSIVLQGQIAIGAYSGWRGFTHLGGGLACGLSGLAAGMSIGIIGDAGLRAYGQQPRLYTALILCLIFTEALAIYGLIIGLVLAIKTT